MSLDTSWEQVRRFHEVFHHPARTTPTVLDHSRATARHTWMLEELTEFLAATDVAGQADAMIDLIYFALGTMVEMGVRPDPLFQVVHAANMRKLWPDGTPHFGPDGKTVKPPHWRDPFDDICKALRAMNHPALEFVPAKPLLCVPALLETILRSIGITSLPQETIAEHFGVHVPPTYDGSLANTIRTDDPSKWGIVLRDDSLNTFFRHFHLPLHESYLSASRFQDWEFRDALATASRDHPFVLCGFASQLLDPASSRGTGHAGLVVAVEGDTVTLLDPGPANPGSKTVSSYDLYLAVSSKCDGIWLIDHTEEPSPCQQ